MAAEPLPSRSIEPNWASHVTLNRPCRRGRPRIAMQGELRRRSPMSKIFDTPECLIYFTSCHLAMTSETGAGWRPPRGTSHYQEDRLRTCRPGGPLSHPGAGQSKGRSRQSHALGPWRSSSASGPSFRCSPRPFSLEVRHCLADKGRRSSWPSSSQQSSSAWSLRSATSPVPPTRPQAAWTSVVPIRSSPYSLTVVRRQSRL